jgi:sec-independent protein translocase protein TatA
MNIGLPEIVIIFAVILLLFGAKKLPEMAKSIGRAFREFKKEVSDISKPEEKPDNIKTDNSDDFYKNKINELTEENEKLKSRLENNKSAEKQSK